MFRFLSQLPAFALAFLLGWLACWLWAGNIQVAVHPKTPPDWTYHELVDYLRRQGVEVRSTPANRKDLITQPAWYLMVGELHPDIAAITLNAIPVGEFPVWEGKVFVQLLTTTRETNKRLLGYEGRYAFGWGRFLFAGDPKFLNLLRDRLGVPPPTAS